MKIGPEQARSVRVHGGACKEEQSQKYSQIAAANITITEAIAINAAFTLLMTRAPASGV